MGGLARWERTPVQIPYPTQRAPRRRSHPWDHASRGTWRPTRSILWRRASGGAPDRRHNSLHAATCSRRCVLCRQPSCMLGPLSSWNFVGERRCRCAGSSPGTAVQPVSLGRLGVCRVLRNALRRTWCRRSAPSSWLTPDFSSSPTNREATDRIGYRCRVHGSSSSRDVPRSRKSAQPGLPRLRQLRTPAPRPSGKLPFSCPGSFSDWLSAICGSLLAARRPN